MISLTCGVAFDKASIIDGTNDAPQSEVAVGDGRNAECCAMLNLQPLPGQYSRLSSARIRFNLGGIRATNRM